MTAPETPSPSPLTPEARIYLAEFARDMGPTTSRLILQCLDYADSMASQVAALKLERDALLASPSGIGRFIRSAAEAHEAAAEAKAARNAMAARVSDLEARLESAHRGLGEWRAKYEALETERDSLRQNVNRRDAFLGAAEDKIASLEAELAEERGDHYPERVGELKVEAKGWTNDRPMPECCDFLHHPDTTNCTRCGKPLVRS